LLIGTDIANYVINQLNNKMETYIENKNGVPFIKKKPTLFLMTCEITIFNLFNFCVPNGSYSFCLYDN